MAQLLNINTTQEPNHIESNPPDLKSVTSPLTDDSSVDTLNASPPHNIYKVPFSSASTPQSSTTSLPYYGVWNIPAYYTAPTSFYSPLTQPIYPTNFVNNSNLLDYPIEPGASQLQLSRMSPLTVNAENLSHHHQTALSVLPQSPAPEVVGPASPVVNSTSTSLQTNHHETEASPSVITPPMQDSKYIDITEYLNLPQSQAAKKLHVPTSTLSKRWKEAVRNRKWPYRAVCKLDKEIMTTLYNIPQSGEAQSDDLPPDVKAKLGRLFRERQDLLRPVFIRL